MAIETDKYGNITVTGEHITLYGLLQLKYALKLQMKGVKLSSRGSATQVAARAMGVKRISAPKALEWVEEEIKKFKKEHGDG